MEWEAFGEETDLVRRARLLDEGLEILTGLWRGEPFDFAGRELSVRGAQFLPTPLQTPRIPIWIAGYWPQRAPLRRAARWDGLFALFRDGPPRRREPARAGGRAGARSRAPALHRSTSCTAPIARRRSNPTRARARPGGSRT